MNNVFRLIWSRRLGTLVPVPEGLGTAGRKNRRMMRRLRRLMRKMVGPGAAALTLGMLVPLGAQALPTGGQVVAGQAAIAQNGSQMTITQSSDKAILNWQGFDIGAHEHVTFAQPSTSSVALNRVVGNSASAIYGGMDANGQVFLVNQNGVYFAPGAQVSAGGLLVSTLGITDSDFMAGRLSFSGDSTAGVTNDGTIRACQGGYVAFIGRHVDNEGHIITPGGKTALGAGGAVDISLSGNALVQFRVSADALDAQVKNGGVIQADNGAVVMSARARDALMKTVVNNSGVIEARGVRRGAGGTIDLLGGDSGTVSVSGRLDAGSSADKGGTIAVRGQHVVAKSTAHLDVTGAQGGGEIAFGGGLQGAGGAQAETAKVEQGALLDASATGLGDGGTIAIWSDIMRADGVTLSYGTLLAKGDAQGGDGGMIETSGHRLDVAGSTVSTKATAGADGTWLLDPYNLTVTDSSATSASTGTNQPAGADSTILASSLSTALASGNVTIQTTGTSGAQAGDITVDAAIGWSSDNTLTFDAAGNIAVNAAITAKGSAPGLALKYGQSSTNGAGASYSINAPVSLTSGASFTTQLGSTGATVSYTVVTDAAELQNINLTGLGGAYVLGSDVNLSIIANFTPIGSSGGGFTGQFDGLGHTISNLTITPTSGTGTGGNGGTGGIGGIGGIGPYSSFATGLFGTAKNASLRNVGLIDANVTGESTVGALVGNASNSTISNAYATGTVTGTSNVGGLVGNNSGTISNAYATGTVKATSFNVGGLVGGGNKGTITNAYATGAVSGTSTVGGLVGYFNRSTIGNVYATGAVTGTGSNVGGLVGYSYDTTISNAYATGAVSGRNHVGGLLGDSTWGAASNVYATGAVLGTYNVGGLFGSSLYTTITNGFWDSNATGQSTSAGGTALTSAQMQQQASFTGFDFSTTPDWVIYEGHTAPLLAAFLTPLSVSASTAHVTYDGTVAGASSITTTVTGTAPAGTLFGNLGTLNNAATPFGNARNVGTYDADLWSDQQGYLITQTGTKLTIDPRSLTGSIAGGSSAYGDALAPGAVSFTNAVSGDKVSGTVSVATAGHLSTSGHLNAGSYTGIETVSGLSGADAGNYAIGSFSGGDYTVARLALAGSIADGSSTYGDALAPGAVSFTNVVSGDAVSGTVSVATSGHLSTSGHLNAGSYSGVESVSDLSGTDAGNYAIGAITAGDYTVTQRALNVALSGTPTRVYDGTLVANLVPGDFSISGIAQGDQLEVTQTSGTYASAEIGTLIAVTADLSAGDFRGIGGTDLANYSLPVPVTTNGFGEITQPFSTGSPLQNNRVNRLSGLPVVGALNVSKGTPLPETPSLEIQNGGVKGVDDDAS